MFTEIVFDQKFSSTVVVIFIQFFQPDEFFADEYIVEAKIIQTAGIDEAGHNDTKLLFSVSDVLITNICYYKIFVKQQIKIKYAFVLISFI